MSHTSRPNGLGVCDISFTPNPVEGTRRGAKEKGCEWEVPVGELRRCATGQGGIGQQSASVRTKAGARPVQGRCKAGQ